MAKADQKKSTAYIEKVKDFFCTLCHVALRSCSPWVTLRFFLRLVTYLFFSSLFQPCRGPGLGKIGNTPNTRLSCTPPFASALANLDTPVLDTRSGSKSQHRQYQIKLSQILVLPKTCPCPTIESGSGAIDLVGNANRFSFVALFLFHVSVLVVVSTIP